MLVCVELALFLGFKVCFNKLYLCMQGSEMIQLHEKLFKCFAKAAYLVVEERKISKIDMETGEIIIYFLCEKC
jgi:hypothetical protein